MRGMDVFDGPHRCRSCDRQGRRGGRLHVTYTFDCQRGNSPHVIRQHVLGPCSTVAEALRILATERVDCAIMDVDLQGEYATPAIEASIDRGVPVVVTTGHDISTKLPAALHSLLVVAKPFTDAEVVAALLSMLSPRQP